MTATGDVLNQVVPTLVRVARRPGGLLLRAAAVVVGVFALLGLGYGARGADWTGWVPFALAVLLALPVVVLAVRRERLQTQTQELHLHRTITGSASLVTYDDGASHDPVQEELDVLSAAMAENAVRTARFFPRVEAAQRAGLRAAGGPVNAPYLRDDLRVTLGALIGTIAAIPLALLGSTVTLVLLLSA